MLLLAGHLLPFPKSLLANRQLVSVLPDSEEFLVLAARFGQIILLAVDPAKLQMSRDPIRREIILQNLAAILEDLPPCRRRPIPIALSLVDTCQALVRYKSRILCCSRGEQFDSRPQSPLR